MEWDKKTSNESSEFNQKDKPNFEWKTNQSRSESKCLLHAARDIPSAIRASGHLGRHRESHRMKKGEEIFVAKWNLINFAFPSFYFQLSQDIGYVLYSALGSFYIPSCIMVFVYIRIYYAAKARARRGIRKQPRKPPNEQVSGKVTDTKGTPSSTPFLTRTETYYILYTFLRRRGMAWQIDRSNFSPKRIKTTHRFWWTPPHSPPETTSQFRVYKFPRSRPSDNPEQIIFLSLALRWNLINWWMKNYLVSEFTLDHLAPILIVYLGYLSRRLRALFWAILRNKYFAFCRVVSACLLSGEEGQRHSEKKKCFSFEW